MNPLAIELLREYGIPWSGRAPRGIDGVEQDGWDCVITVCDRAKQSCPIFSGRPVMVHWGMPDPAKVAGDAAKRAAFRDAFASCSAGGSISCWRYHSRNSSDLLGKLKYEQSAPRLSLDGGAHAAFTPFVALYVPTARLLEETGVMQAGDKLTFKQKTSVIFGGRVSAWVAPRVGFEASLGYSPSGVHAEYRAPGGAGTTTADGSASVVMANARVLVGFGPAAGNTAGHVILGGGIIAHSGDAWAGLGGTTDFGGIVGLGGRFRVGPKMAIRIDVEDNLFSAQFKDSSSGALTQLRHQNDLIFTGGLSLAVGDMP